jgi:hypothetical protein
MSLSSQEFESYVPVYDACPENWEDARGFLAEHLKKISNAVNVREIGWLLDTELLSGKSFIPAAGTSGSSQQYRSVLRKVIDFGALPNTGSKDVLHGIVFDNNFTLIQIWASATQPSNYGIPIPYAGPTPIQIYMDTTKIVITTSDDRSAYTRCYVFIEYIQEL